MQKEVRTLEGPISLSEHLLGSAPSKFNVYTKFLPPTKHFYIFGDRHNKDQICSTSSVNIVDFFKLTFKTGQRLDVFLETQFASETVERSDPLPDQYLYDIYQAFKSCLTLDKTNCPYPNVRFHYADVRNLSDQIHDLHHYYQELSYKVRPHMLKILQENCNPKCEQEMIDALSDTMWNLENRDLFPLDVNKIMKESKIDKQLKDIKDFKIRTTIREFFLAKFSRYHLTWEQLDYRARIILEFQGVQRSGILIEMLKLFDNLSRYLMTVMDFYLMARVFRDFEGQPVNNVFIYAGERHAEIYRELLSILNFRTIAEEQSEDQCVNLTKFRQPFFT